jgi:hypothetical protein
VVVAGNVVLVVDALEPVRPTVSVNTAGEPFGLHVVFDGSKSEKRTFPVGPGESDAPVRVAESFKNVPALADTGSGVVEIPGEAGGFLGWLTVKHSFVPKSDEAT